MMLHLFARALQGVAGAVLRRLQHKIHPSVLHRLTHALCLVANDHVDVCCRNDFAGCRDDMGHKRFAANLVQHFRAFGFQPRAFAGGHDHNGKGMIRSHCSGMH